MTKSSWQHQYENMNRLLILLFPILTLLFSCNNSTKKMQDEKIASVSDSLHRDSAQVGLSLEEQLKLIPKNIRPVFGYRFIISGDFDGDGKKKNW